VLLGRKEGELGLYYLGLRASLWLTFTFSVLYFISLGFVVNDLTLAQDLLAWVIAMIPLFLTYRSWSILLEVSTIPFVWLFLTPFLTRQGAMWYLPLVAAVIILVGHRLRSCSATLVAIFCIVGWTAFAVLTNTIGFIEVVFLGTTLIWVAIYILETFRQSDSRFPRKIDVILCSFSGNTGHYTEIFTNSLAENGITTMVHRFHRKEEFNPILDGDTLVLAFPVSAWKPPWLLMEYMFRDLPRGKGKPAFILYTSAGGPENAGFIAWIILALRGYRVLGRLWSIYPLNVPTFRLGPKSLWQFIDSLTPFARDTQFVITAAQEFSKGEKTGFPFVLWPTPLVLLGFLLDNRWINRFIYRSYVWRRRCIGCNFCVNYCPLNRFSTETGIPKAQGTCCLCFGCVNHCPQNAMQMRFWSEYGQPYKSRWPKFIVKK